MGRRAGGPGTAAQACGWPPPRGAAPPLRPPPSSSSSSSWAGGRRQGWIPEQPPLLLPAGWRMSQLTPALQPRLAAPRSPEVAASRPPTFRGGGGGTEKVMCAF